MTWFNQDEISNRARLAIFHGSSRLSILFETSSASIPFTTQIVFLIIWICLITITLQSKTAASNPNSRDEEANGYLFDIFSSFYLLHFIEDQSKPFLIFKFNIFWSKSFYGRLFKTYDGRVGLAGSLECQFLSTYFNLLR